jgi:uncharacterized protein YbjT (DUF2867 family)
MADIILVAGATGGTGQQIVGKLMTRGFAVRALVRDLDKARKLYPEGVELVEGDTRQPITLPNAVVGARAVICATGTRTPAGDNSPQKVDFEGVRNLVLAARNASVPRFVLISMAGATQSGHPRNNFGRVLDWKLTGENALRHSGLAYTIIRPGTLTDAPGGQHAIQIDQGDRLTGTISRSDLAAACIHALDTLTTYHTTFEIVNVEGDPHPLDRADYWQTLFANLKTDRERESA